MRPTMYLRIRHGEVFFRVHGTKAWVNEPMARLFYGARFEDHYTIVNLDKEAQAPQQVCYA